MCSLWLAVIFTGETVCLDFPPSIPRMLNILCVACLLGESVKMCSKSDGCCSCWKIDVMSRAGSKSDVNDVKLVGADEFESGDGDEVSGECSRGGVELAGSTVVALGVTAPSSLSSEGDGDCSATAAAALRQRLYRTVSWC